MCNNFILFVLSMITLFVKYINENRNKLIEIQENISWECFYKKIEYENHNFTIRYKLCNTFIDISFYDDLKAFIDVINDEYKVILIEK